MSEVVQLFKGKEAIEKQNGRMVANTFKALQAVERLKKEGFTIIKAAISQQRPIIWVQPCEQCVRLSGSWFKREHTASGTVYTWEAAYAGAFIQWQTTSPNRAA
ncbi:MAG: hypothetical protein OEZ16_07080 [Chromatiales bacterium]|nr:hypothetical protein [Chromatiales bacterium]